MTMISASAAASATAPLPRGSNPAPSEAIFAAAGLLLPHLERGDRVDAATLRSAMETAFGASDATGAWDWKTAYDACEAATVLFLRKYGKALFRKAGTPAARLSALAKIAGLLPTHTRRSAESQTFQQFSTPIPLGLVAAHAAAITPTDRVLEPSAGTGLLAILAEIAGGALVLNELAETRAGLLDFLFPTIPVTRFDAAQIDDHLDPAATPSIVLMNPPFSAMANVEGRVADTTYRHVASALARLAPGGRLVTITGASFAPDNQVWRDAFVRLQERGRVVFSAAIDGTVYAKHGTTFPTRLTVIDKRPSDHPGVFPVAPGVAPDAATLLGWLGDHLPERFAIDPSVMVPAAPAAAPRSVRGCWPSPCICSVACTRASACIRPAPSPSAGRCARCICHRARPDRRTWWWWICFAPTARPAASVRTRRGSIRSARSIRRTCPMASPSASACTAAWARIWRPATSPRPAPIRRGTSTAR
mgnify:CR=1 FL=1